LSYVFQKFALFRYKPWLKLSEGLHCVRNINAAPKSIAFTHPKYHVGFEENATTEEKRRQHYKGAK
jgi:hypothetical protein